MENVLMESRLADVNDHDSARILLYAGRPLTGACGTTEPFVKRTQMIGVGLPGIPNYTETKVTPE